MTQIAFNKSNTEIRHEIEKFFEDKLREAIQPGRALYGIAEKDIRVQRKVVISQVTLPALFVFRGPYTTQEIGGHRVLLNFQYDFVPIAFDYDPEKSEEKASAFGDGIFDLFLAENNDRDFDGNIYDITHQQTSPIFQHEENNSAYWLEVRFNVAVMKRLN